MTTPNQRHDALEGRLLDLLYGELSPEEATELRAELAETPELLARFEGWQGVQRAMASLPEPEPDPQVHYEILRAARTAAAPAERRGFWETLLAWSMSPVAAGLGLLVLAGGMLTLFSQQDAASGDARFADSPQATATKAAPAATAAAEEEGVTLDAPAPTAPPSMPAAEPIPAVAKPEGAAASGDGLAFAEAEPAEAEPTTRGPLAERKLAQDADLDGVMGKKGAGRADNAAPERERRPTAKTKAAPKPRSSRGKRAASKSDKKSGVVLGGLDDDVRGGDAPRGGKGQGFAPPPPAAEPPPAPSKRPAPQQPIEAPADDSEREEQAANAPVADLVDSLDPAPAAAAPKAEAAKDADEGGSEVEPRRPARRRATTTAADVASGSAAPRVAEDGAGATAPGPAATLAGARAARDRGDLRGAAQRYDEFGRRYREDRNFGRAMFEAAQTYEQLGDTNRAIRLYRLVASLGGADAGAARARINALTPPAQKAGEAPPSSPAIDASRD